MRVAIAVDDKRFGAQLQGLLSGQGHDLLFVEPTIEGLVALTGAPPELLVAAGIDCAAFVKGLRGMSALAAVPVLCVNPRADVRETVAMLDAGADDAITRPFQGPIFLARVRTLLRRQVRAGQAVEEPATTIKSGPIELRLVSRQTLVGGKPVELTRLEFDLLGQLMRHPDRAFRREELLAAVWNYPAGVETRTLDKHMESLRRKLPGCAELLKTVHGVGYRFSPPESARR